MISDRDRQLLTEAGREYILDAVIHSKKLKEKLSTSEHRNLSRYVNELTYEEVISLTITEDIRKFEGGFSKFLKYSLAAIAGMAVGGIGLAVPTVAMFTLYLYRKATDTCEKSCFTPRFFSSERKVCKLSCQLNAARKMANDLSSEVSKCGTYSNPKRCENKLQKEHIKWVQRVRQLTVRLNAARVAANEKERKERFKQQQKLRQAQSPQQQTPNMDNIIITRKGNTIIVSESDDNQEFHFKVDPNREKQIRMIMYLGLWAVPIPFFNDLINYVAKKYSFGCVGKCAAQMKVSKDVCYAQCSYLGSKYAVDFLRKQLPKCNKAKNRAKCKQKIYNLLEDWEQRKVERQMKFEKLLRDKLRDKKEKQDKIMAKRQQGNQ